MEETHRLRIKEARKKQGSPWIKRNRIVKTCVQCSISFETTPSRLGKFCSRACSFIAQSAERRGKCLSPETTFKPGHKMSDVVRGKISQTLKENREQHWNWKGGITPLNYKVRNGTEYKTWRDEVYRSGDWSCSNCGMKCSKESIVAHHIMSFAEFPDQRFNPKNGIVFCRKCHLNAHREVRIFLKNTVYATR